METHRITLNGEFKMQNKKEMRKKANGQKLVTDAGKAVTPAGGDAKKGAANSGKTHSKH